LRYEGNIFRPFSEAKSYLLQCTVGCSHNQCTFCGMYKDKKYRERQISEIMEDIKMAKDQYGDLGKVFLCDGDAIALDTDMLLAILKKLYSTFPSLRHVGSYVGPQSTLSKSMEELKELRVAGLTKAYIGVETGDDKLLKKVKKGVGYDQMLEAGRNLVAADINLSAMVCWDWREKEKPQGGTLWLRQKFAMKLSRSIWRRLLLHPYPKRFCTNKYRRVILNY